MRRRFSNTSDSNLNYLSFTAEQDNSTISLTSKTSPDIKYSLNDGEWTQWDYNAITLNIGDVVYMKGDNNGGFSTSSSSNRFNMTGKIAASGNIMSLLYEDDFEEQLAIPCTYCYSYMFDGCTSLTTAPELPATTLSEGCYSYMFYGCTSLTKAPSILPATTLAYECYSNMFYNCTSLTTAPELPATTLAIHCYQSMFYGCISLTTAPQLPATTLTDSCYKHMFRDCTSLTTAPELPADMLTMFCYQNMFYGCISLTTAPQLPATTLADNCYMGMFDGCTSLTTAPELPADMLTILCYYHMFNGCSKLNYIKMLATNISAFECLDSWVNGVASTGTFVKHPDMTSLPSGTSGIPSGWTVEDYVEGGNSLITFTIDNVEYQAEEGMTWEEWINSEYNVDGYILHLSDNYGDIYDSSTLFVVAYDYGNSFIGVEASDLIESNNKYILTLN